ncbi:MAG: ABC transporter ATP-binding protein/permease [Acidimicrobiia bacterium]|nr:ABC transporter ATP-binding protein/permease [Acidimicrobiia bacterium]
MFHGGGWYARLQYDEDQDKPKVDRGLLKRVFAYARPYRLALVGVFATILVISGLTVLPAILIRELLDRAIPDKDFGYLTILGLAMVAVPFGNAIVGGFQRWLSARVGEGIIFDLRRQSYAHLQAMSLRFFTNTRTGELISRLNNDVVGAQSAITGTFVTIVSNLVSVVVILVVMLGTEWRLTVLAVAALPLFVYPARRVAKVLRRVTEQAMEHNANMSSILQETFNVSGALLVKLFNRSRMEQDKFAVEAAAVRDLGVRRALVGRWFFAALGLVTAVGTAGVFWVGGAMVINGVIEIGELVMFSTLTAQLYGPLSALSNARVEFATSLVSFERVFEVLDLPLDIGEKDGAVHLGRVDGRITFQSVSFRYDTGEGLEAVKRFRAFGGGTPDTPETMDGPIGRPWAVRDVSFDALPGQMIALVGPSGAGKTTISYLVPRLYDVTEGAICIDGHDVRDLTLGSIADAIGIVTQESYLFHDTIGANLRYAKPDATEDELVEACRAANILDFIDSLPNRFETLVGERGYRLSGGEKQRMAIARVILKNPRILILDEATSHLDSQSEALIQDALERVMEGRTSIVIAHRLSTILAADRILVLQDGRLVEAGTHNELLDDGGLYAALFETQFRNQPIA